MPAAKKKQNRKKSPPAIAVNDLRPDEAHPAAQDAYGWLLSFLRQSDLEAFTWIETFGALALSGNRLAEVCLSTLRRLVDGNPVSDRYLLGLAWTLRTVEEGATPELIKIRDAVAAKRAMPEPKNYVHVALVSVPNPATYFDGYLKPDNEGLKAMHFIPQDTADEYWMLIEFNDDPARQAYMQKASDILRTYKKSFVRIPDEKFLRTWVKW